MERGVIAAPAIIHRLPQGLRIERTISPEEVRFYTMYWDHVVIPGNNLIHMGVPDEEELIASGALLRPRVQYSGTYSGDMVTDAVLGCQAIVAGELAERKDVDWALHQFGGDIVLPPRISEEQSSVRMSLASVLPAPSADVHVHDVLNFKLKNSTLLHGLHDALDDLYFDILASPDRDLSERKALGVLQDEINGVHAKVGDQPGWRRFDLGIEFRFTPQGVITALAAGSVMAVNFGIPVEVAGAASLLGSSLEIRVGKSRTVGESASTRLGYISSAIDARVVDRPSA